MKARSKIRLFVVLLAVLIPFEARGQSLFEMALKELSIAKKASLLEEEIPEAPWPTIVITGEEIRRFGWFNLRDLLDYQPSFYLVQDVNERVIAHRGVYRTNTSHLLFLENDFDLSLPEFRAFVGDNAYSLYGVSRIEIVKGPGASLYGDAAFTGVVGIERKALPSFGLRGGLGEYDHEEFDLAVSPHSEALGRLNLLFHYEDYEGEQYYTEGLREHLLPRPKNHSFLLHWQKKGLELFYLHLYSRYETPRSQSGHPLSAEDRRPFGSHEKIWQHILGLKYSCSFRDFETEIKPFFSYMKLRSPQIRTTHQEGDFLALDIKFMARTVGLEALSRYRHQRGQFLFGFDWKRDDYETTQLKIFTQNQLTLIKYPSTTEDRWAVFAEEKFFLRQGLVLNAGFRYDHYEAFDGQFSPRLSLVWEFRPSYWLNLSYGEAFQTPAYFYRQKNVSGYGALKDLDPEEVRTLSLSLLRKFGDKASVRVTFYREEFDDLLSYNPEIRAYTNAGSEDLNGLEFEFRYFTKPLIAFLNYSFYTVEDASHMPQVEGDRILYLPRWMIKGGVSLRSPWLEGLYLSPQFKLFGRSRGTSGWISPYAVWDLNLYLDTSKVRASLKVENLFDKHYHRGGTLPPTPWPGRIVTFYLEFAF